MRRALILLGGGPTQEPHHKYDHPFFGQILLASILGIIGYPNSLNLTSNADVHSIEAIHLIPRLLMGLFAVLDTFLIYKITDYRYGRRVAFIAAILFAVMPSTWFIRRIFLESIQLPFLLTSIFFALYYLKCQTNLENNIKNNYKQILVVLLSGIFLGLAVFTKVPAFTVIPLVAYIIYKNGIDINKRRRLRNLGIWVIPVILIPAIWPAYAASLGQFDEWIDGVSSQSARSDSATLYTIDSNNFLVKRLNDLYKIDPILVILGVIGTVYAALKRDFFCLLWLAPILIFFYLLGFVRTFYLIPLLPVFCIAAAILLGNIIEKASANRRRLKRPLFPAVAAAIVIFGLLSTATLITQNVNLSYFELYSFIVRNLPGGNVTSGYHYDAGANNNNKDNDRDTVSVIGNNWAVSGFSWVPLYIYGKVQQFNNYVHPIESQKVILLIDKRFMNTINNITQPGSKPDVDQKQLTELRNIYDNSDLVAKFDGNITKRFNFKEYPYFSMEQNNEMGQVDVRMNY